MATGGQIGPSPGVMDPGQWGYSTPLLVLRCDENCVHHHPASDCVLLHESYRAAAYLRLHPALNPRLG